MTNWEWTFKSKMREKFIASYMGLFSFYLVWLYILYATSYILEKALLAMNNITQYVGLTMKFEAKLIYL